MLGGLTNGHMERNVGEINQFVTIQCVAVDTTLSPVKALRELGPGLHGAPPRCCDRLVRENRKWRSNKALWTASSFDPESTASIRSAPAASVWAWRVVEVGVASTGSGAKAASLMASRSMSLDAESHWESVGAIRILVALCVQKLFHLKCPCRWLVPVWTKTDKMANYFRFRFESLHLSCIELLLTAWAVCS